MHGASGGGGGCGGGGAHSGNRGCGRRDAGGGREQRFDDRPEARLPLVRHNLRGELTARRDAETVGNRRNRRNRRSEDGACGGGQRQPTELFGGGVHDAGVQRETLPSCE